jgi:hypothetical protein
MSVSRFPDILEKEILDSVLEDPIVVHHRRQNKNTIFSYPLSEALRHALTSRLGIPLENVTHIPMKWAYGDQCPHADVGSEPFQQTCLVYLTDNQGTLLIEDRALDMKKNTGYVFDRGLIHGTKNTTTEEPRLMIGPMSPQGAAVGLPTVTYYYTGLVTPITSVTVGTTFLSGSIIDTGIEPPPTGMTFGGWYISYIGGPMPLDYNTGDVVQPDQTYNSNDTMGVVPYYVTSLMCFGEETEILCLEEGGKEEEKYVPIHMIRKGDLVKTCRNGYKKVDSIGTSKIYNPGNTMRSKNRLYKLTPEQYPEMTKDLFLTGCHSILVNELTKEEHNHTVEILGKIYVTDGHYRLPACVDPRAKPVEKEGLYNIWHLALENTDYYMNYGVYANGLLVETTSKRMLKDLSGMTLIESSSK